MSHVGFRWRSCHRLGRVRLDVVGRGPNSLLYIIVKKLIIAPNRSEEHTSELQSLTNLVCRLLLEKKKNHMSILLRRHTKALSFLSIHGYRLLGDNSSRFDC